MTALAFVTRRIWISTDECDHSICLLASSIILPAEITLQSKTIFLAVIPVWIHLLLWHLISVKFAPICDTAIQVVFVWLIFNDFLMTSWKKCDLLGMKITLFGILHVNFRSQKIFKQELFHTQPVYLHTVLDSKYDRCNGHSKMYKC